jgi:hypothetical protein
MYQVLNNIIQTYNHSSFKKIHHLVEHSWHPLSSKRLKSSFQHLLIFKNKILVVLDKPCSLINMHEF